MGACIKMGLFVAGLKEPYSTDLSLAWGSWEEHWHILITDLISMILETAFRFRIHSVVLVFIVPGSIFHWFILFFRTTWRVSTFNVSSLLEPHIYTFKSPCGYGYGLLPHPPTQCPHCCPMLFSDFHILSPLTCEYVACLTFLLHGGILNFHW